MNIRLLIDSIVRQTMVLIVQLATSGGLRAPLAHVAGQAFLELAKELESQGVTKKVSADMFGMALRTYQRRTQRLSQSRTDRGRSLWEALFDFIERGGVVTREEILRRFRHDDEASLRGVLRDLTESGLVFSSGSGRGTAYRIATSDELGTMRRSADSASMEAFVWSFVYREGKCDRRSTRRRVWRSARRSRSGAREARVGRKGRSDPQRRHGSVPIPAARDRPRRSRRLGSFGARSLLDVGADDHAQAVARSEGQPSRRSGREHVPLRFMAWSSARARDRGRASKIPRAHDRAARKARSRWTRPDGKRGLRVDAYYGQSVMEEEDEALTREDDEA